MDDCNCEAGLIVGGAHYANCESLKYLCEWCHGTGEVDYDEHDRDGNLIGVGTLTKKCICKLNRDDE